MITNKLLSAGFGVSRRIALTWNGMQLLPPPSQRDAVTVLVRKQCLRLGLLPAMFRKRAENGWDVRRRFELARNGLVLPL